MENESYPDDWAKVVLMVSPRGEAHAIGGDREVEGGDSAYIGLKRLEQRTRRQKEEILRLKEENALQKDVHSVIQDGLARFVRTEGTVGGVKKHYLLTMCPACLERADRRATEIVTQVATMLARWGKE